MRNQFPGPADLPLLIRLLLSNLRFHRIWRRHAFCKAAEKGALETNADGKPACVRSIFVEPIDSCSNPSITLDGSGFVE